MNKLVVTVQDIKDIDLYREMGADELVLAVSGHSLTGLPVYDLKEAKNVSILINKHYFPEDNILDIDVDSIENIYFSDFAILYRAKELGIVDRCIYKPDTLMTNPNDINWWLDRGIKAVSVSPLLTRDELLEIGDKCHDLEVTIHGHLVMSTSRRKLLSAHDETIDTSTNYYIQEEKRDGLMPIFENKLGTIVYTDFIQESLDEKELLTHPNITRYLIDTVYMERQEILDTIKIYRDLLDGKDVDINGYKDKYQNLAKGYYDAKTIK